MANLISLKRFEVLFQLQGWKIIPFVMSFMVFNLVHAANEGEAFRIENLKMHQSLLALRGDPVWQTPLGRTWYQKTQLAVQNFGPHIRVGADVEIAGFRLQRIVNYFNIRQAYMRLPPDRKFEIFKSIFQHDIATFDGRDERNNDPDDLSYAEIFSDPLTTFKTWDKKRFPAPPEVNPQIYWHSLRANERAAMQNFRIYEQIPVHLAEILIRLMTDEREGAQIPTLKTRAPGYIHHFLYHMDLDNAEFKLPDNYDSNELTLLLYGRLFYDIGWLEELVPQLVDDDELWWYDTHEMAGTIHWHYSLLNYSKDPENYESLNEEYQARLKLISTLTDVELLLTPPPAGYEEIPSQVDHRRDVEGSAFLKSRDVFRFQSKFHSLRSFGEFSLVSSLFKLPTRSSCKKLTGFTRNVLRMRESKIAGQPDSLKKNTKKIYQDYFKSEIYQISRSFPYHMKIRRNCIVGKFYECRAPKHL